MGWDNARKFLAEGLLEDAKYMRKQSFELEAYDQKQRLLSTLRKEEDDHAFLNDEKLEGLKHGYRTDEETQKQTGRMELQGLENKGALDAANARKGDKDSKVPPDLQTEFDMMGDERERAIAMLDKAAEDYGTDSPEYEKARKNLTIANKKYGWFKTQVGLYKQGNVKGAEKRQAEMNAANERKGRLKGVAGKAERRSDLIKQGKMDGVQGWTPPEAEAETTSTPTPAPAPVAAAPAVTGKSPVASAPKTGGTPKNEGSFTGSGGALSKWKQATLENDASEVPGGLIGGTVGATEYDIIPQEKPPKRDVHVSQDIENEAVQAVSSVASDPRLDAKSDHFDAGFALEKLHELESTDLTGLSETTKQAVTEAIIALKQVLGVK